MTSIYFNSSRRYYVFTAALILCLKFLLFAIDHLPMFFLGDSVAYMNTAEWNYIPLDRSFLYGWLIRVIAYKLHSITCLLAVQTLASGASAFLAVVILRHYFNVPARLAAAMGILCALEPLQLLYERYIMTEAFSLLVFAGFSTLALAYLRRPRWYWLICIQIAGVLLIALRFSFLPIVQVSAVLVPLLAVFTPDTTRRVSRLAGHLAISLACFLPLHAAYKSWCAAVIKPQLPGAHPAYLYDRGFHLLCFVAPIVVPHDFPDPEKRGAVFNLAFDLKDPAERGRHRWWHGGLIGNIKEAYPGEILKANRIAEITAHNAVRRDPLGELRLATVGFAEYFNRDHFAKGLVTDQGGDRELPDELLTILHDRFGIDGRPLPHVRTLTNGYYFFAWPWYFVLLLSPMPAFLLLFRCPRSMRPGIFLFFTFAAITIVIVAICTITPTVRYLHPLAWQTPILVGAAFARVARGDGESQSTPSTGTERPTIEIF